MASELNKGIELKSWIILIFLSIIWGTSFILIKKSLLAFSPIQVAILRISISGLAFAPFFFYYLKYLDRNKWWQYLFIALTGSGIPAILYATAQTKLSSATTGILNSLAPIFTLIIGVIIYKNRTNLFQISGVLMGFVGASLLLILNNDTTSNSHSSWYGLLVILGAFCYAANVNLIKARFQHTNSMHFSAFSFFILGIPVLLVIPFTNIPNLVATHPRGLECLGYLTILAVVSTVFAIVLYYKLVQQTDAVFGSSVAYLIPGVALFWGIADGEHLYWFHFMSLVFIALGVYLVRKQKNHKSPPYLSQSS